MPQASVSGVAYALCVALLFAGCSDRPDEKTSVTPAMTNAAAKTPAAKAAPATNDAAKARAKRERPAPAVIGFDSAEGRFILTFNGNVSLVDLKDYVKVSPNPGPLTQDWWPWTKTCRFEGRFQPRVTYTVTVRAGLPMSDGRVTAKEFRRTWTAPDASPCAKFASGGRYLPASGRRAVAVKTMNVTNLVVGVGVVPDRNITQILAREEDVYRRYYGGGGDSRDAAELAASVTSRVVRVRAKQNEEATTFVDVRNELDVAANGVYLLSVREEGDEDRYAAWKLVCVTDIGLSVREIGKTVCVWATSLATGAPIPGLRVRVLDERNVVLADGLTGADGLCRCELKDDFAAFAVIAERPDASDRSFLALRSGALDETSALCDRRPYVADDACEAFVWTERGIYRHGEKILVHAILRNGLGNAPKPFPVRVALSDPKGQDFLVRTLVADCRGVVTLSDFAVPDDQPSGRWEIFVTTPERDGGEILGRRTIMVEEFVPPQIRVKATPPAAGGRATTNLVFEVAGEHLFGGPAKGLPAEGAVRFADAPFAPTNWPGYRFGDENRAIGPNFRTLKSRRTDDRGVARFAIDFPPRERPRAAVEMTVQGSVFEGGGRPASARAATILHCYPFYIGVAMPDSVRESATPRTCRLALVNPDGTPHAGARRLVATYERVECVYGLQKTAGGGWEWRSDKIRQPIGEDATVAVGEDGRATLALPASFAGDVAVRLLDEETGVSFGATYWVGGDGDDAVRTPLENPSRVTLSLDKRLYCPGERPRLTVKAPFAGTAWLTLLRDRRLLATRVVALTNATSEIELEPVAATWMPGVDVALSVVQAAKPGDRAVANRAFGLVPMRVATRDQELEVKVGANVACAPGGGSTVEVDLRASSPSQLPASLNAVVTLVDEGVNLLTDEPVPDPAAWFGEIREAAHPIHDVFNRLLPIYEDAIRRAGVKTGGGAEGDLFRRLSPVPTRRFRPLSLWKANVPLTNGCAKATFSLPEFVGEVRVTAVVCGTRATGAGAVRAKVAPNLVMQPDAPRFAAPGDAFLATLTLANRSGKAGRLSYEVFAEGDEALVAANACGEIALADGQSETVAIPVRAAAKPGEAKLVFKSRGFGETHEGAILVPVRPAAPWTTTATTLRLAPGEKRTIPNPPATMPEATRRTFVVSPSPVAQLASALSYLVAYPYGCLEQTVSRVFPLVTAGGILNTLPVRETTAAADAKDAVGEGVRRVCSMIRAHDFSMWPDGTTSPWDREVSLGAAHFLVEANASGFAVPEESLTRVKGFLRGWAMSTNATESVAACHVLALAGAADRDRSLSWYDRRAELDALSRARLARAFVRMGDRDRARTLLADVAPLDVKDTSAALLAWLDLDPKAERVPGLVTSLLGQRDAASAHWGTTERNAAALLALGAYFQREPAAEPNAPRSSAAEPHVPHDSHVPRVALASASSASCRLSTTNSLVVTGSSDLVLENRGATPAFVSVRTQALGDPAALAEEARGISISRRFLRTDGRATDLSDVVRGEMLEVELTLVAPSAQTYSDLVVDELLPACFEPVAAPLAKRPGGGASWELRRELRDDRVLGFSRRFSLKAGESVKFVYAVRVVSAGDFVVPGASVEAMYAPEIRARGAATRITVAQ